MREYDQLGIRYASAAAISSESRNACAVLRKMGSIMEP